MKPKTCKYGEITNYELYKRYLQKLNLSPVEYEKRLREWCKKNKF